MAFKKIKKKGKLIGKNILYGSFHNLGWSEALISRKAGSGKLILTYHNVLPEEELTPHFTNTVDVSTAAFEFQIKTLKKLFGIQPADKIKSPQQRGIFISFDDGMLNNIEIIEPILSKYGVTAMFGICTGLVDGSIDFIWRDHLYLMFEKLKGKTISIPDMPSISGRGISAANLDMMAQVITEHIEKMVHMDHVYAYLENLAVENKLAIHRHQVPQLRYTPMGIADIQNLQDKGHLIASHTHTHRKLAMLSQKEQDKELSLSRNYLIQNISSCDTLVYPYGSSKEVNEKVGQSAEESGYLFAFMNTPKSYGPENYFLPRLNMRNISSEAELLGLLAGINKIF